MEKWAQAITDFYIKKKYVPEDKREIYCYGFKLIISDIINFSLVMLLGAVFSRFMHSIIFLMTLCSIRLFSGGFHAKTFWMCRLSMLITFSCVNLISLYIGSFLTCGILFAINIFCVIVIGILSPIKHPHKKLTQKQRKTNKIKAIITSFIFAVISNILIIIGIDEGVTISITLAAVVLLMVIGILYQKGGENNV